VRGASSASAGSYSSAVRSEAKSGHIGGLITRLTICIAATAIVARITTVLMVDIVSRSAGEVVVWIDQGTRLAIRALQKGKYRIRARFSHTGTAVRLRICTEAGDRDLWSHGVRFVDRPAT
jgi:hypothetical protein